MDNFVNLTIHKPVSVRFIELMPTNDVLKGINEERFISAQKVQTEIQKKFENIKPVLVEKGYGPASYYQLRDAKGVFGFITAVSQHFCGECNRIRLTAEGNLRPCLFSVKELELKKKLREIPLDQYGLRNELIREIFKEAVKIKPSRHHLGDKNSAGFDMFKIGG